MTVGEPRTAKRLTPRGAKTRARIVATAADMMRIRGVTATTIDDVVAASGVSKSQFYHHFAGKEALVRAVIEHVGAHVIQRERDALGSVSTISGLRRWRDTLVHSNALQNGAYGCALGSLASEVADHDDVARQMLFRLFGEWQTLLADVLRRLQEKGKLPDDVAVADLATGLIGALQGGYLLAQTSGDVTPMAKSLDMALASIERLTAA